MKVLMVLGRSAGGIGGHVDTLTRGLRSRGHDVRIITDRSTAQAFGWTDAEDLWPLRPGLGVARAPIAWHLVMRRARSVDVVHAHGHQAAVVAAVAVARARPRPRLVVSLHNDLPPGAARGRPGGVFGWAIRRAIGWALGRADFVTGASPDLVDLARSLGARRAELAPVTSARVATLLAEPDRDVDDRRRAALRARLLGSLGEPDPDRPLMLTISRIAPQKDLHTLVAAARRVEAPATWVVVGGGDPDLRARLEKEAAGIRLHFVGPRDDIDDWLHAADLFVLTSRWEARALVVQEAMAAGLPVVAPRTGGLPGLIVDAGLLTPPGDSHAVALAVDRLLGDTAERARLGARGRELARGWDDVEAEARQWIARYTATLER